MRFIVLTVLYIAVIIIKHLQWKNLLAGESGEILSYINIVFFYPLATACLVGAAFCVILRKTAQRQIIMATNVMMGIILTVSSALYLWENTFWRWTYTAPNAPVTLTFPNGEWKTVVTNPHGYRMTVVMKGTHVGISVFVTSQDADNIHNFDELLTSQQIRFKENYKGDAFKLKPCKIEGFKCATQEYIRTAENGKEKTNISMFLLDDIHLIQIAAIIDEKYTDEYYDEVMAIMNTAKAVVK
ncbi:hypothetical protein [Pseudocitrobacter cyperus]|uniref:Uncharacterized protein n=1 Tax=Pseudocitrobacter cyperus TaxID=3112843 RepID=A0ABV0HPU2_9ENTR